MTKHPKQCLVRLVVGLALNIALWLLDFRKAGGPDENIRMALSGCLAVAAWVFVVPVFWRGASWQAPIAFALIFYFPTMALLSVLLAVAKYW